MNAGEKEIDWLFRKQLRVVPEWSIKSDWIYIGGPIVMPKESRSSALKAVKTAKVFESLNIRHRRPVHGSSPVRAAGESTSNPI